MIAADATFFKSVACLYLSVQINVVRSECRMITVNPDKHQLTDNRAKSIHSGELPRLQVTVGSVCLTRLGRDTITAYEHV